MAVLVEGISVITRIDAVRKCLRGGWAAFVELVPNATLCYDDDIARVGFLSPSDVENYVTVLRKYGLRFIERQKYIDIAILDQLRGPASECEWLEFGRLPMGSGEVSACWFYGGPRLSEGIHIEGGSIDIVTPPGWIFEGSLSHKFQFVPMNEDEESVRSSIGA